MLPFNCIKHPDPCNVLAASSEQRRSLAGKIRGFKVLPVTLWDNQFYQIEGEFKFKLALTVSYEILSTALSPPW